MNKALELQLVREFPTFFREYGGDPKKTCMAWGVSHGNGWFELIHRLCSKLKELADADPNTDFHFKQIKEKFARLTIYSTGGNNMMNNLIDAYEEMSMGVCEKCGSEDNVKVRGRAWIQTLCEQCAEKK
jgi:hypothetical protein